MQPFFLLAVVICYQVDVIKEHMKSFVVQCTLVCEGAEFVIAAEFSGTAPLSLMIQLLVFHSVEIKLVL